MSGDRLCSYGGIGCIIFLTFYLTVGCSLLWIPVDLAVLSVLYRSKMYGNRSCSELAIITPNAQNVQKPSRDLLIIMISYCATR